MSRNLNKQRLLVQWTRRPSHERSQARDLESRKSRATVAIGFVFVSCVAVTAAQFSRPESGGGGITPIDSELCDEMRAKHVLASGPVPCNRLALVKFPYLDFNGKSQSDGELVVIDAAAPSVLNVLNELRRNDFPIAKAKLLDNYDGNDDASMSDNNTSAFNDRKITGGGLISLHAYGLAIDVNPVQNPYLKKDHGIVTVSPSSGEAYVNRTIKRPGMAEALIDIFADNGFFVWGGFWHDPVDYQHFQVSRKMAEQLASAPSAQAKSMFASMVERYRACRHSTPNKSDAARKKCIAVADPNAS
jgi:D-alanyl-D-alanine carboxypeptidase-like protein